MILPIGGRGEELMITEAKAVFAVRFLLMQCVSVMCVCVLVWELVA